MLQSEVPNKVDGLQMFKNISFIFLGISIGVAVTACSDFKPSFPYVWFTYDFVAGKLLGKTPADDAEVASECAPTATEKTPCAVIKMDILNKVIADDEKRQIDLNSCQHPLPTN